MARKTYKFTGGAAVLVVLAVIAFIIGAAALNGFIIMVLWGAIAGALGAQTIGFGTAILVSLALSVVGGFFKKARS